MVENSNVRSWLSLLKKSGWTRYATALETHLRAEALPWCDLFIARGRALAAFGRGNHDSATIEEVARLRDEAERVGLKVALPELES